MRFKSFRARLLFVFLSLFLVVEAVSFLALSSVHERHTRRQVETGLRVSGTFLGTVIDNRNELLQQASAILSRDYAFQQAFATQDQETVRSALTSLRQRVKADLMLLVAIDGDHPVVVDTRQSDLVGKPFPVPDLITRAEDADGPATGSILLHGRLYSTVLVPLLAPETVAWFCIGFLIDDPFLAKLQKATQTDVTVVRCPAGGPPSVLASTLRPDLREAFLRACPEWTFPLDTLTPLGSEAFLLRSDPLDAVAGLHLVYQHSFVQAMRPFRVLQRFLLTIGLAGLLVTLVGAFLLARGVSGPVLQLAAATRKVETGDFETRLQIDLDDEIGELGRSFNHMVQGLAEKDRIRSLLGKVVSSAIAEELLKNEEIQLGGEEREVTILFCDIRGFTTLCEGRAPTEILDMLNQYLTRMCDVIEAQGGVVDKFIGDAIMAIFGAPLARPDDVDHALAAALGMIRELGEFRAQLSARGFPPIDIGIGINTGNVVAGNMGSRNRLNYTVIGDGVNLASRLESQCKEHKRHIIISEQTLSKARGTYRTEYLGEVKVKGKQEPTRIHALHADAANPPAGTISPPEAPPTPRPASAS